MNKMNSTLTQPPRRGAVANLLRRYLLAGILFSLIPIAPAIADTGVDYWAPWVTKTTTHSATINWRGENDGLGLIDYATASYYGKHQGFEETIASLTMGSYQHVELTHLEPNTSYIYRVRPSGNAGAFTNRTFRTMPVSGAFTFVVISDSQEGHHYTEEQRFKYIADAIAKEPDVLFILHGGDNAGFDDESLWSTYFHVADGMLAKSTIFPTIGNHEYHNPAGKPTRPPLPINIIGPTTCRCTTLLTVPVCGLSFSTAQIRPPMGAGSLGRRAAVTISGMTIRKLR